MTTENTSTPRRINYRSDFDLILSLKDCKGNDLGWPPFDWRAEFYTWSQSQVYTASCIGGVCTNCFNNDGQIHVVFDNHGLLPGGLKMRLVADLRNVIYPDGTQTMVSPVALNVSLVKEAGDCHMSCEAEVNASVVFMNAYDLAKSQGYAGTLDEYIKSINALPDVVKTGRDMAAVVSDFVAGKAEVAEALTRQGAETEACASLSEMARKVLGLKLAVPGVESCVDMSFGGLVKTRDLLNAMYNNRRAEFPYLCGVVIPRQNGPIELKNADAYLCSDGFFTTEACSHEIEDEYDYAQSYVLYYFREPTYTVPMYIANTQKAYALNGHPSWPNPGFAIQEVISFSQDMGSFTGSDFAVVAAMPSNGTAIFAGVEEIVSTVSLVTVSTSRALILFPDLKKLSGNKHLFMSVSTSAQIYPAPKLETASVSVLSHLPTLTRLYLPQLKEINREGIQSGDSYLFTSMSALAEAELPAIEEIDCTSSMHVFHVCNQLSSVKMPQLKRLLSGRLFHSLNSLKSISLPALTKSSGNLVYSTPILDADLPALEEVSGGAIFQNCNLLTEVTFPELTKHTGGTLVHTCSRVERINLPKLTEITVGLICYESPKVWYIDCPEVTRVHNAAQKIVLSPTEHRFELHFPKLESITLDTNWFIQMKAGGLPLRGDIYLPSLVTLNGTLWRAGGSFGALDDGDGIAIHLGAPQFGSITIDDGAYFTVNGYVTELHTKPGFRSSLNIPRMPKIKPECIKALVANLADNNDSETRTLRIGADNIAKLTEEEIAIATAKNYTLA